MQTRSPQNLLRFQTQNLSFINEGISSQQQLQLCMAAYGLFPDRKALSRKGAVCSLKSTPWPNTPQKKKKKHWRPHGCQLTTQLEQQQVRKRCYCCLQRDRKSVKRGHLKSAFRRRRFGDKTFLLWVLDILVQSPKETSQQHPSGAGAALEET